jgi:hypothetical protein
MVTARYIQPEPEAGRALRGRQMREVMLDEKVPWDIEAATRAHQLGDQPWEREHRVGDS